MRQCAAPRRCHGPIAAAAAGSDRRHLHRYHRPCRRHHPHRHTPDADWERASATRSCCRRRSVGTREGTTLSGRVQGSGALLPTALPPAHADCAPLTAPGRHAVGQIRRVVVVCWTSAAAIGRSRAGPCGSWRHGIDGAARPGSLAVTCQSGNTTQAVSTTMTTDTTTTYP